MQSARRHTMIRERIVAWFRKEGRPLPWREIREPYPILVSEFMLQQTQVATVIGYFNRWMLRFPDVRSLAEAPEAEVLHAWAGLGYYARARNLHRAAQQIIATHAGTLPNDLASIAALPGVGAYTAGAVASFAFDRRTPVVDTNIARVIARLIDLRERIDTTRGRRIVWQTAEALLPAAGSREHNSALMELGALVCTARLPKCPLCPIRRCCAARNPDELPVKKAPRKSVPLLEDCAWIVSAGRVLFSQQIGPRWRGLWKLPVMSTVPAAAPRVTLQYAFTHHRVTLRVFDARVRPLNPHERWFQFDELSAVAIAAPHQRALAQLAPAIPLSTHAGATAGARLNIRQAGKATTASPMARRQCAAR